MYRALTTLPASTAAGGLLAPLVYIYQHYSMSRWRSELAADQDGAQQQHDDDNRQRMSNAEFLSKVLRILKLGMGVREVVGMIVFCCLFVVRSWATMRRVNANSRVLEAFAFGARRHAAVMQFVFASLTLAAVDSIISNVRFWLIASLRETLSASCHKLLMERDRFARANYEPECDAAQSVPSYCGEFAEHLAELPLYFLAPSTDAVASLLFFWRSHGTHGARIITATTLGSLFLIRAVQPDVARMHARVVMAEGAFQRRHYTVQENSEAISMASGSAYFYEVLNRYLHQVYAAACRYASGQANFFFLFRAMDLAVWDVVPLLLWLRDGTLQGESAVRTLVVQREATRGFTKSAAILFKNIREISHLKEFTQKLCTFIASLSEVDVISNCHDPAVEPPRVNFATSALVAEISDVDIRTPTNVELMRNFSLRIEENTFMMVVGPNGTGKTSLYRVLCGLWPVSSGRVRIARDTKVLCLPQQSFHLRKATLREQLWFPARPNPAALLPDEFDIAVRSIQMARLDVVVDLIGGWASPFSGFANMHLVSSPSVNGSTAASNTGGGGGVSSWLPRVAAAAAPANTNNTAALSSDGYPWHSLSGGQKQKLAIARLFFTILMDRKLIEMQHPRLLEALQQQASGSALRLRGSVLPSTPLPSFRQEQEQLQQRNQQRHSSSKFDGASPSAGGGASAGGASAGAAAAASSAPSAASHRRDLSVDDGNTLTPAAAIKLGLPRRRRYLVLLDESTSQVDGDAEESIVRALKALPGVTILCISHRKQMSLHADKILLLSEGNAPVVLSVTEYLNSSRDAGQPSPAAAALQPPPTTPSAIVASESANDSVRIAADSALDE